MRYVLRATTVAAALAVSVACEQGEADSGAASATEPFAGTWSLASWQARTPDGQIMHPFGERAAGRIMYDATGHMAVQLMRPDRPRFGSDDPFGGTAAEMQAAFQGFFAYYRTYTVQPADTTVTHHLVGASFPNWIGTDQVRHFTFSGDTLVLSTPLVPAQGATAVHTLKWVRER